MKLREIAELVGGELIGDGDTEITSVADISRAHAGQLAFYEKKDPIPETNATCVIASQAETRTVASVPLILVADPKLAFAKAATLLHKSENVSFIHQSASIADSAKIGSGTHIHAGVSISENVTIGENCIIHPNVAIYENAVIGSNVILHAGVIVGADGFGYVRDAPSTPSAEAAATPPQAGGGLIKFPQIGTVVIEDNVEIGANTCIDRGALGETRIGEGTKIDNLVQVGHNVSIGKRCVIAAQTGISGSVVIEDDCVIGGQVGFGDHVHVQSGAIIGSQAGVLPGKIVRPGVWWGTPIQPLDEYKRQNAMVKGLGRLREDVKELKKRG